MLENIATYGWHCVHVPEKGGQPSFTYTIGLYRTFKHPELVIYGVDAVSVRDMLQVVVRAAREGKPLDLDQPSDYLLEEHSCVFVEVPYTNFHEHIGLATWFYEGVSFPVRQIVWAAGNGRFPWHPDAMEFFRTYQPLLVATH